MSRNNVEEEYTKEEIIRELMNLRSYLEKRMEELKDEAEKLEALSRILNEVIITKSFKKAEKIPFAKLEASQPPTFKEEVPLKTAIGTLLAVMYVGEDEARVIPGEGLAFSKNTPPFQTFLLTRILEPMRIKDREDSHKGEVQPNKLFSYEIITEDDIIKEIRIKNFRTKKRLREVISSTRWTLDKMYEKNHTSD